MARWIKNVNAGKRETNNAPISRWRKKKRALATFNTPVILSTIMVQEGGRDLGNFLLKSKFLGKNFRNGMKNVFSELLPSLTNFVNPDSSPNDRPQK